MSPRRKNQAASEYPVRNSSEIERALGNSQLGIVRVTRVVDAVAAGRIINTKTAVSQIMGSVVWGIGMALHEETLIDHNFGRVMNANIAEYHVPVHADVHGIKAIFVEEPHSKVNPMRIKGVGEMELSELRPPSPTPSIIRLENACATCR